MCKSFRITVQAVARYRNCSVMPSLFVFVLSQDEQCSRSILIPLQVTHNSKQLVVVVNPLLTSTNELHAFNSVPSNCTTGDVRLVNGRDEMEGRVEVCRSGVWGAIGNRKFFFEWSYSNARVTCRQLGYPSQCKYYSYRTL